MFAALAKKFIGSANDRLVRRLEKPVADIAALEPAVAALSDSDLAARTGWLRERLAKGEALDDLLPDAFGPADLGIA